MHVPILCHLFLLPVPQRPPRPPLFPYTTLFRSIAKAGLDQMARSAANELLAHKIRVNVLYPGWTDTPGERKFFDEDTIQRADRKSTRLNSSHLVISYAVFCLKKKNTKKIDKN